MPCPNCGKSMSLWVNSTGTQVWVCMGCSYQQVA